MSKVIWMVYTKVKDNSGEINPQSIKCFENRNKAFGYAHSLEDEVNGDVEVILTCKSIH